MKRDGDSWKPGRNAVPPIWQSVGYAGRIDELSSAY
jgi:hypothetical protein